ncbi:MAG: hypothetical protein H7239_05830 [Flavobacterium sp.]|nr:hypothetical protein [Flavobacterium sp.]
MFAQEHFSGLNTSSQVGIMTATLNPAELVNMKHKFQINVFSGSINVSNNKIGFSDLTSNKNLESLIFTGSDPVNLRADAEFYLPSIAMKYKKFAFAIIPKGNAKLDVVDVDTHLGDAITNAAANSIFGSATTVNNNYNQRVNGTTWGEIGFTGAMNIVNNATHKINIGTTLKMLFPGSYANLGLDKFQGTIVTNSITGQAELRNTTANLNIAYSGGLTNSFTNFNDYTKSVFGGLNGFSGDIGVNYQWKDLPESNPKKNSNKYKLNVGMSIKNIGSMTFKDDNNSSKNYLLQIQGTQSLNLNQFQNVNSLPQIETILLNSGYLIEQNKEKNFKVKLPTTFNLYADVKLIPKFFISGLIQQKINNNSSNDQITAQNIISITPRFDTGFFEVFAPFNNTQISGFSSGIGFRVGGFYLGSGSIITALINDSKQGDIYTGYRFSFL